MIGAHGGFAAVRPKFNPGAPGEMPITAVGDANKGVIGSSDAPTGPMASLSLCDNTTSSLLDASNGKPPEKPVITGILRGPGAGAGGSGGLVAAMLNNAGKHKPRVVGGKEENGDLENEAAAAVGSQPTKTPVSVLQELCVKRQITPKYDLIQIEGSVHEPTFKYRVTVGEYIEHGTGQSKKKAKHAAAKAVLDKLIGSSNAMKNGSSAAAAASDFAEAKAEVSAPFEDGIPGNPVGALQEFCMSRRLPPPIYELSAEDGLPHERLFTIDCVIGKNRASGTGKSKKLAKRQAAHRLLENLKDTQPDNAQPTSLLDDDDELLVDRSGLNRFGTQKDGKISVMNLQHTPKLLQFHRSLMAAKGEKITSLKTLSLTREGLNFAKFLQEIALEQNFEVTFVDIEEQSKTGKFQCLVQLSTLPVAVCYGSGDNKEEAQSAAAHNALEYLKIMAK